MAAQGTFTLFNDFARTIGSKLMEFPTGGDDFKVIIINNTKVAAATDATPEKGDYTEVSGGTYVAQTLANQDFTLSGNTATFTADAVTFDQDAGAGPVDCYQALLYLDDGPNYECIGFIELTVDGGTTPLSLQDAPIGLNPGSGTLEWFKVEVAA